MSAPWIKLHTDLMQHPKTARVLGARGGANAFVGLISVWCWAGGNDMQEARDGHITDPMLRRLGVTKQQAGVLEDAGFLTRNGDGYHLHGWDQHQGKLRDRREKEAARQRALRASKNT